ncbi:MAG: hypothetical protein KDB60_06655 [Propionibacteriaceae bacterium]|nr:hypothetical protein [Propionibacteriaceae bacterium]
MGDVDDLDVESEADVLPLGLAGKVLLEHWLLLLLSIMLGAGAGVLLAMNVPPTYTATATQLVKGIPGTGIAANYEAAQFAVSRARSYPSFIYSQEVLDGVARDMGTDDITSIREAISATNPTDTPLVQITATGRTAEEARDKANSAARHMATFITDIETVAGRSPISVETAVQALLPQQPSNPRPLLYAAIGSSIGLMIALIIAFARHFARQRSRPEREPRRKFGWRRLKRSRPTHAAVSPTEPVVEAAPSSTTARSNPRPISRTKPTHKRGRRRRNQMASRRVRRRV